MANNFIPTIGAAGLYRLQAPFDTLLIAKTSYTCIAIRRLADFVAFGGDPKADYYTKYGVDDDTWTRDFNNPEVCIVSLQTTSGAQVYVPSTFILSYPNMGGVPYTSLVLGINLGPIPDKLNLSNLYTSMVNLVRDTIGINADVRSVAVSETELILQADHEALEVARQALIQTSATDSAKLLEMSTKLDNANTKLAQAEAYILANIPPP